MNLARGTRHDGVGAVLTQWLCLQTDGKHGSFQLRKQRPDNKRQQHHQKDRGGHGHHYGGPRDFGGDRWTDSDSMRPGSSGLGGPGARDLMGGERQRHQPHRDDRGGPMMQRRRVQ